MPRDKIVNVPGSNVELSVNGRVYDLTVRPKPTDPLVIHEKDSLRSQINLDDLNDYLSLSIDLFFLGYNGAEGVLQARFNSLLGDIAMACQAYIVAINSYERSTENISRQLSTTFKFLSNGQERMAFARLKRCRGFLLDMSETSESLSNEIKELQKRSLELRSDILLKDASDNENRINSQEDIRKLVERQHAEKTNLQKVILEASRMQEIYDNSISRMEPIESRSFILDIASTINITVGAGLGTFAVTKNPIKAAFISEFDTESSQEEQAKLAAVEEDVDQKKASSNIANQVLSFKKNKLIPIESKIERHKKEIADLSSQIKKIEGIAESDRTNDQNSKLTELQSQLNNKNKEVVIIEIEIAQLLKEIDVVQKNTQDFNTAFGKAVIAQDELLSTLNQKMDFAAVAEQSISKAKIDFLDAKLKIEADKRESLVALLRLAEDIKNTRVDESDNALSVLSLDAAIKAMDKIVWTLTNANIFWEQMARFCDQLAVIDVQSDMNERISVYTDVGFMNRYLRYSCQWAVFKELSTEHFTNGGEALKRVRENISQFPSIEEAQRIAPELATDMGVMLLQKIKMSDEKSYGLLHERARF